MKPEIVLVGGGGHCKSVIETIERADVFCICGIVDLEQNIGSKVLGIEVFAADAGLADIYAKNVRHAAVTLGSIGDVRLRKQIHRRLEQIGFLFPAVIDPSAVVSDYAKLGRGVFIGKRAVINAQARIGDMAIVNTGAIIEHDCRIGDFAHIAPGAILSGGVVVEENVHLGAGCTVIQGIHIARGAVVGAGSVVISDILDSGVYAGCPCRRVKQG